MALNVQGVRKKSSVYSFDLVLPLSIEKVIVYLITGENIFYFFPIVYTGIKSYQTIFIIWIKIPSTLLFCLH